MIERMKVAFLIVCCFSLIIGTTTGAESICEQCKKPIGGSRWVEVEGHHYHRNHFLCAHCLEPIIPALYFTADGRFYDSTCYINHIAPRCGHCSKPVSEERITLDSVDYHSQCYNDNIATRCFVCTEVISGMYYTDGFGNPVCSEHRESVSKCNSCGRFLGSSSGPSTGQRFPDGRLSCLTCLNSAVMDLEQARPIVDSIIALFGDFDIHIKGKIKLKLVSQGVLSESADGFLEDRLGVTLYQKETLFYGVFSRKNFRVHILYGLPRMHFKAIVAHELMHVWLYKNGPDDHEQRLCEGSCEYASYLALMSYGTKEARALVDHMLTNPDPIYGEGFRRVMNFVNRSGIANWLEYMKENSSPPW